MTETNFSPSPLVVQTEHLASEAADWLAQRCRLQACSTSDARFQQLLTEAEGLIIRTYTQVDAGLLSRAPRLRVVGRAGVGLDNIDLAACSERGITVVHTPDANTQAVVDYVLRVLLDAVRPLVDLSGPIADEKWIALRRETVGQRELPELTVGILGMGRVGQRLAQALTGLGCRVLYHDLLDIPAEQRHGAESATPNELCSESHVISMHVDARPSNRGLIDHTFCGRLRDDVLIINTSRGFVVDAAALAGFLQQHPAARAVLDVHDPEPITADYPLLGLANVRLTPHLASRTEAALLRMSWVIRDVWAVLCGKQPTCPAPRQLTTIPADRSTGARRLE